MRQPFRPSRTPSRKPRRTRLFVELLERREVLDDTLGSFLFTPLNPAVPLAQHQQVHLSIRADGQEQPIPARLGITDAGTLPVHTGDKSGWVNLDSPTPVTFHLADVFATWGQPLGPQQVLGYHADGHPLTLEVNHLPSSDWGSLVLRNGDDVVIRYGPDKDTGNDFYLGGGTADTAAPSPPAPIQVSGPGTLPDALSAAVNGNYTPTGAASLQVQDVSSTTDPAVPGPYATTRQQYNFGTTAFQPSNAALAGHRVELTAEITAPTNLGSFTGPLPVVVLLHGRHVTTYNPMTGQVFLEWPAGPGRLSIPSYQGYEYLADNLASHGYVVVSVSANGVNAFDNGFPIPFNTDLGALARAELLQRTYDILHDLNTGSGTVTNRPGDTVTINTAPFGTRYVNKLDLQNIGLMGHSRGGEGIVRSYALNQSLGSPYGIKAVLPLAPVDFTRITINGVPLEVILPYDDGDVSDLQGVHFYDDSLYNVPGDRAPKHTILVNGADHNFFNTIWSPGVFAGGSDDSGYPADLRLTQAQERAVGLDYMAAFFRTYVGNATVPVTPAFLPMLRGDVPPPASALTDQVYVGYEAPDAPAFRRDVNRERTAANLTTNNLGGAVLTSPLASGTDSGITTFNIVGAAQLPLPGQSSARQPHETPSARSNAPGLNLLRLQWTNTLNAFYENDLPAGTRDVSGYYALSFRASTVYSFTPPDGILDNRNKPNLTLDFSVTLTDGQGNTATVRADNFTRDLYYPFGPDTPGTPVPRVFLNSVRIPLGAFGGVNLTDVRSIRFNFDQKAQGEVLLADLAFADPATTYAGPFVVSSGPANAATGASSFHVRFNTAIDPTSFTTDQVRILAPDGSLVPITDVSVTPGSDGTGFDVSFAPLGRIGVYSVQVGPNVRDTFGHPMDQNFNGVTGENPGDVYTTTFVVHGPRIIASTPSGSARADAGPVSSVRVTFNTSMDPATFTPAQVRMTGPTGAVIPVTVAPVDGTDNTQFDISFAPQSASGRYTLTIGPNVRDPFGNPMDQDDDLIPDGGAGDQYVATFAIVANYTATSEAAQNFEIFGQAGTQAVTFSLGGVTADDDFGVIDLVGGNTFTFYGQTYTRLFVGSNGLITLGGANSPGTDFRATDLRFFPPFATIAVYWTDLFKSGNEPMIVWKVVGSQLIIEWYRVTTFDGSPLMTFQAVLDLNTGAQSGDILLNYANVTGTGDGPENIGVTVGVKDVGTGNDVLRTLVEDGTTFSPTGDPRVQTGRAVRFHSA